MQFRKANRTAASKLSSEPRYLSVEHAIAYAPEVKSKIAGEVNGGSFEGRRNLICAPPSLLAKT